MKTTQANETADTVFRALTLLRGKELLVDGDFISPEQKINFNLALEDLIDVLQQHHWSINSYEPLDITGGN